VKRLLLVGAGHAHAQVLLDWALRPLAGCEVVVVSPAALAPYSGMVPGWLAGAYAYEEICIDVAALAARAGARFVADELSRLDPGGRRVLLRSGDVLTYDVLSLNVGSTLQPPVVPRARVLSMRPLGALRAAWERVLGELPHAAPGRPLAVTAIGGGAAGVEALLAVRARLGRAAAPRPVHAALVTSGIGVVPGLARGAVRRIERALADAGVTVQIGSTYCDSVGASSDLLLWATGAVAHAWQRDSGLAVSEAGFIRIDRRLRSVSHPEVFAVGDCAEWADPLPKAGVYAVRMGPVLARNLRASLDDGAMTEYAPQRRFLMLLATADGRAVASYGPWSAGGRWVLRWKERIDRAFLRRFQATPPTAALAGSARSDAAPRDGASPRESASPRDGAWPREIAAPADGALLHDDASPADAASPRRPA
jgi:pyridine nucleotide-disulfide oxidoreductase family protein